MNKKTIIDAEKKGPRFSFADLFHYRDLFGVLAYRDYRVRYAQTFLGFLWAFLQPAITLVIFILIFQKALQVPTQGIPYPIFVLTGLTLWSYFSFVVSQAGKSIISEQGIITKIYFPRLIIPLSKSIVGFVDFIITFLFLIILLIYYHTPVSIHAFWLLALLPLTFITSLGCGIWISAMSVRYRDFIHVVPFIVQVGLYVSPIAYPASIIPEKWLTLYYLNPMAGLIEAFRWCMIENYVLNPLWILSVSIGVFIFISSLIYFSRIEKTMADYI